MIPPTFNIFLESSFFALFNAGELASYVRPGDTLKFQSFANPKKNNKNIRFSTFKIVAVTTLVNTRE